MAIMRAAVLYLKHFGWNRVGLITSSDLYGETELMEMVEYFKREGICFEYIIIFPDMRTRSVLEKQKIIEKSISRVIIIACQFSFDLNQLLHISEFIQQYITLLVFNMWRYYTMVLPPTIIQAYNCSISFSYEGKIIPGLSICISKLTPETHPTDPILEDIWFYAKHCNISNEFRRKMVLIFLQKNSLQNCTGLNLQIPAEYVSTYVAENYYVYSAVYSLAHALHDIYLYGRRDEEEARSHQYIHKVITSLNMRAIIPM